VTFIGSPTGTPVDALPPYAIAQGFYERNGITMTNTPGRSLSEMAAALVGGSADLGLLGVSAVVPLMGQGECFRFLTANQAAYYRLIARPDVPLAHAGAAFPESVRDLRGRTIGMVSTGGAQERILTETLAKAGMSPADVTMVPIGGATTSVPAFQAGQVDVMMSSPPAEQLLGAGNFQVVADFLADPALPGHGVVQTFTGARCDYVDQHPELVRAYCRATTQAQAALRDPAGASGVVDFMAQSSGLSTEVSAAVWQQYSSVWTTGEITPEIWAGARLLLPPGVDMPDYSVVDQGCQEEVRAVVAGA
jgi:NitT/TauT family transport system substrate-binding protein